MAKQNSSKSVIVDESADKPWGEIVFGENPPQLSAEFMGAIANQLDSVLNVWILKHAPEEIQDVLRAKWEVENQADDLDESEIHLMHKKMVEARRSYTALNALAMLERLGPEILHIDFADQFNNIQ